jgi:hypothetical protein
MPEKSDIAQLIGSISSDARRIIQGEVALAKKELKPVGVRVAIDGVFASAAVYLLLVASVALPVALAAGLSWAFHGIAPGLTPWACVFWGCLVALVLILLVAGVCALVFLRRLKTDSRIIKERVGLVAANAKQAFGVLREGIAQGQELVEAGGRRD